MLNLNRELTYEELSTENLSRQFRNFAAKQCRENHCALYEALSLHVAASPPILQLCLRVRKGQPAPNMLFAAVRYLLLGGSLHPLQRHFDQPTVANEAQLHDAFDDFCATNARTIGKILATRAVQTHELRRCATFMPAIVTAAHALNLVTLHFVDVGCSLGLSLLWDKFRYIFAPQQQYGPPDSAVRIASKLEPGNGIQSLDLSKWPLLTSREGIELNNIELQSESDLRWIRALVWPNRSDWTELFAPALELARVVAPLVHVGDARYILPRILQGTPESENVCCLFCFSSYQMFRNGLDEQQDFMDSISADRNVFAVTVGNFGNPTPHVYVTFHGNWRRLSRRTVDFAECETYGRWLRPLDTRLL